MACPELGGCQLPSEEGLFCAGSVGLVSVTENVSALDALAAQSLADLPSFLPEGCVQALRAFTCGQIIPGCSKGSLLPMCRSVCQGVRDECGSLIIAMMPGYVQQDLDCQAYAEGSWPQCAERDPSSDCFASSCSGTKSLQDRPCGICDGYEFTQLAVDGCGVCNGDNTSCSCDGLLGSAYDACGECGGSATVCRNLETDPRMLGFLCMICCVLVLVSALLVVLRRQWCKRQGEVISDLDPAGQARPTMAERAARVQAGFFSILGRCVARHPWLILAVTSILAGACGTGLLAMQVDEDVLEIWVPYQAESVLNRDRRQGLTAQSPARPVSVLLVSHNSNFSGKDSLVQALKVHRALTDIVVNVGSAERSLLGSCASSSACHDRDAGLLAGPDSVRSPLQLWSFDASSLEVDPDPVQRLKSALADEPPSYDAASLAQLLAWEADQVPGPPSGKLPIALCFLRQDPCT